MTETLREYAAEYEIHISDRMLAGFRTYNDLLLDWNQKLNLTAITEPREVEIKHFLDSLLGLEAAEIEPEAALIDVGTGAGFPGIPLKIARRDLKLTLLDSLGKRVNFLQEVSDALEMKNRCVHARAEEAARDRKFREQFDVATARAVAALPVLCEYCLPFVKPDGVFLAYKGGDVDDEARAAEHAIEELGGEIEDIRQYSLPCGAGERSILVVRKISQTPTKYPRNSGKITKAPL